MLKEATAKLDSLACFVHGTGGQNSNQDPKGKPTHLHPHRVVLVCHQVQRAKLYKSLGQRDSPGKGGSSPPSSNGSKGFPMTSFLKSVDLDSYAKGKNIMRIKNYDTMKLPPLPKNEVRALLGV